jgi:hypothetical protein
LEEQLKQKKKLSPIVPIIIYQGKKRWKIRDLSTYFGKSIPESLLRYLPRFDYHLTHVNALSDEVILALGKSLLVNALFMIIGIFCEKHRTCISTGSGVYRNITQSTKQSGDEYLRENNSRSKNPIRQPPG